MNPSKQVKTPVADLLDATAAAKALLQSYSAGDFASGTHTHILSDVDELVDALASKYDSSHVGTTANKLVQLTAAAKLPAVDGSLLTNIVAVSPVATSCLLFIAIGDSNSGGNAPVTDGNTYEISSRNDINFFNVTTQVFENLDLGTNNNLSHTGLNSTTHAWELEVANAAQRGEFDRPVYYVQCGQGSSASPDWAVTPPGAYPCWPQFLIRVAKARELIAAAGRVPTTIVLISLGINDSLQSVNSEVFRYNIKDLLERIRVLIPGAKFVFSGLPDMAGAETAYATVLSDIDSTDSDVAIAASTNPYEPAKIDTYHWSYAGYKTMVSRMLKQAKTLAGLPQLRTTWTSSTMTVDETTIKASAGDQFAYVSEEIYLPDGTWIEFDLLTDGMIFTLAGNVTDQTWATAGAIYIAVFRLTGSIYWTDTYSTTVGSVSATGIAKCRFRRNGNNLAFDYNTDGSTWGNAYERTGVLSGLQTVRAKCTSVLSTATVRSFAVSARGGGSLGLGTAAYLDVGTSANQVVQLTAAAKLPAVDGSLLTNLPGGGGTPTAITIGNEATDTTCFVAFVTGATGDLGPKTNTGFKLDSATLRLCVGSGTSTDDGTFISSRATTGVGPHGFRDETTHNASADGGGYGAFDAITTVGGSSNYNHMAAFQCRQIYNGSGTVGEMRGVAMAPVHNGSGTITYNKQIGVTSTAGSGPITWEFGIYSDIGTTRATNNHFIYHAGGASSYHKGQLQLTLGATEANHNGETADGGQLVLSGFGLSSSQMQLGYNTTGDYGWLQAAEYGSSYNPIKINPNGGEVEIGTGAKTDNSSTAGQTRFFLYDVDNATMERVTVGAADSGGSGYKLLRIPN